MIFIDFDCKHGIGEGLYDFTLNLNLILFWHNILFLNGGTTSALSCIYTQGDASKYKRAAVSTAASNYKL